MLTALLSQIVAVGLGCAACSEDPPTAPPTRRPAIQTSVAAASDSACRVLDVATSGSVKVPPPIGFPDRTTCGAGLTLITGGSATYNGKDVQQINIPVRILNRTTGPVQLPIRVILSPQAIQIIGSGTPSNVTAIGPDSVLAGGSALWRIGTADSVLRAGDSTVAKTVTIRFVKPATHAKLALAFDGMAVVVNPVAAVAPDSTPAWFADDSSWVNGAALKGVLGVRFSDSATSSQRQAAIDSVAGQVIGGSHFDTSDPGLYFIRVPGGTTIRGLDSLAKIVRRQPGVLMSIGVNRVGPAGRTPRDSQPWRSATFNPDSASVLRTTWNLEMVSAPLAWGCSIGSADSRIAVVDVSFDVDDYGANLVGVQPTRAPGDTAPIPHGTEVANILAARGTVTGMMWYATLRAYRKTTGPYFLTSVDIGNQVTRAILDSASVVNLSLQSQFDPDAGVQQIRAIWDSTALRTGIALAQNRTLKPPPLIVVAAGNDEEDAAHNGFAQVRGVYPSSFLVVAANGAPTQGGIHRWGDAIGPRQEGAGSNYGDLIDVYAPGELVSVHGRTAGFRLRFGTSFAVPLVAGTAGLLKSFDTTLTTEQLQDLILRGAQNGGRTIVEQPTKYLLNAYESLKLAAQRNPRTPICGFPVSLNGPAGAQYVNFDYTEAQRARIPLPQHDGYTYASLSVAQGGRLLAVGGTLDSVLRNAPGQTLEYRLINGQWSPDATVNNVDRRMYLERDTVDQHYQSIDGYAIEYFTTAIHRETGVNQTFTFGLTADQGAEAKYEWPAAFSPNGNYALVPMAAEYPCVNDGGNPKYEVYVFDMTPGAPDGPQPLLYPLLTACQPAPGPYPVGTAWAAASDRFLLGIFDVAPAPAYYNTVMRSATGAGSAWTFAPDVTFTGALLNGNGTLAPAGDEFYWSEFDLTAESLECYDVARSAASPYRELSRSLLSRSGIGFKQPINWCLPEILNPGPNAAASAGDPTPGQWLRDARRHPRSPVRVQGN